MFLYLETRFLISLQCRLQDVSNNIQFIPILLVKGDEIVLPCDRRSNETDSQEFLRKFENRGIKIARVNSFLITKSINLPFLL